MLPSARPLFLTGVFLCCHAMLSAAEPVKVIRLRADAWMPYNGEAASPLPGYAVEVARLIFEPAGYKVDYQTMPWADALKAAAAGEIEGVIGANAIEAAQLVVPGESIGQPMIGLYVCKDSKLTFTSVAGLAKVRLGVIDGYSYWTALDAYLAKQGAPQVTLLQGSTPLLEGIGRLDRGELDVLAESQPVWLWTVKSSGRLNKNYHSIYLQPGEPVYVAFAKGPGEELARLFEQGLARLRASGELTAILQKYYLSDWK